MDLKKMNIELLEEINNLKNQNISLSNKNKELTKQLLIHSVSQQSELLAFLDVLEKLPRVQIPYDMKMYAIKQYLKANCG